MSYDRIKSSLPARNSHQTFRLYYYAIKMYGIDDNLINQVMAYINSTGNITDQQTILDILVSATNDAAINSHSAWHYAHEYLKSELLHRQHDDKIAKNYQPKNISDADTIRKKFLFQSPYPYKFFLSRTDREQEIMTLAVTRSCKDIDNYMQLKTGQSAFCLKQIMAFYLKWQRNQLKRHQWLPAGYDEIFYYTDKRKLHHEKRQLAIYRLKIFGLRNTTIAAVLRRSRHSVGVALRYIRIKITENT